MALLLTLHFDASFDLLRKTRNALKINTPLLRISSRLHVHGLAPALKRLRPSNHDTIQMHLQAALGFLLCQVLMGTLLYNR